MTRFIRCCIIFTIWGAVCSPFILFTQKVKPQKKVLSQKDSLKLNDLFVNGTEYFLNQDFLKAINTYSKIIEELPGDAAVYHQLSKSHEGLGQYLKSINYERNSIKLDASNKYYYLHMASLLRQIKDWKELSVCYEAMIVNCEGVDHYKYDLAQIYFYYFQLQKQIHVADGLPYKDLKLSKKERKELDLNFERSLRYYDEYGTKYGFDLELIKDKQGLFLAADRSEEAIQIGNSYLLEHPNDIVFFLENTAIIEQYKGQNEAITSLLIHRRSYGLVDIRISKALIAYYSGLSKDDEITKELELFVNEGKVPLKDKASLLSQYVHSKYYSNHQVFIKNLVMELQKKNFNNSEVSTLMGSIYIFEKQYREAVVAFKEAIGSDRTNKNAWYNIISCYAELEEDNKALEYGKMATVQFPEDGEFYAYVFELLRAQNMEREALFFLNQAIDKVKETDRLVAYLTSKGDLMYSISMHDSAYAAYEEALVFAPNNALALNNYSYYLALQKEDLNKAKLMAKRLILLNPNTPAFLDTYGWVLFNMQEYKEASLYLEKAASLSNDGDIFEHYGDVLSALKRSSEAIEYWERAIKLKKETTSILIKIKKEREK